MRAPSRLAAWLLLPCLVLGGLRLWPHDALHARIGSSIAIYDRHGELLRLSLAPDQQYRLWTPLHEIAPLMVQSSLLYEDRAFWWHPGVNPAALLRSSLNMLAGGRREGGSTITMQLARRLYRIDSRSLPAKLHQIAAAFWLELRHSKREILEAYLNSVPMGGNVEGVGAASLIYFRHPAASLGMQEALTLAVIPQNPMRRLASRPVAANADLHTALQGGGLNPALEAARARLWRSWLAQRPQEAAALGEQAILRPPAMSRSSLPFAAPHLSDFLLAHAAAEAWIEDGAIHSTLDLPMQRTLERVMSQYLLTKKERGLRNATALLLDADSMEVRAVVGSAHHGNAEIEGQVNGSLAKRSPGSTLKPFIYALALDQGLLHPLTLLKDAPTAFGPYTPENYDGQFAGPVTAADALIRSRNVPAVAVAAQLSQPNLYQFLQLNQVARLQSEAHYGLALVLGGGEVSSEELARLYALLANAGEARPLSYTRVQAAAQRARPRGQPLLSPAAAFITLEMLRQTPRPDTGAAARPRIAWKTGTSWGFRDAWTAGVFGRHVLVVWVGEFDGRSNPSFIGIEAAAPLFLRMVDALRAQGLDPGELAQTQPPDLQRVEVCAATGGLPDELCSRRLPSWFIAGKSPILKGDLLRAVWIDERNDQLLCGPQAASAPYAKRILLEQWGSEMQRHFRQVGLPRRSAPGSHCAEDAGGGSDRAALRELTSAAAPPRIASPLRGQRYLLPTQNPPALQLRADAAADVKTLFWFAGDSLLGRSKPGASMAWTPPGPGSYALRVVDEQGRADVRQLQVEALAPPSRPAP